MCKEKRNFLDTVIAKYPSEYIGVVFCLIINIIKLNDIKIEHQQWDMDAIGL